jgi:hypothetical protein
MSEAKHTPGPWQACDVGDYSDYDDGKDVVMRRIEMDHKAKIAWVMNGETALASFDFDEFGGANNAQMAAETYIDERQEEPWELRERIAALEARIAKADALADAHSKLWSALAEIIEAPGMSPNATVRRMAARAEKALVEDSIAEVKPVPRFYREGSDT